MSDTTTPAEVDVVEPKATKKARGASNFQQLLVLLALVVIYVFFMIMAPNFAQLGIAVDILSQSAYIGVMALGTTFIIATGGIDLSCGTGMSLVAVMAGVFLAAPPYMNLPLGLGLLLVLLVGALLGLINGVNVAFLGLPPFIATLAMMMAARGLALVISETQTISIANPGYKGLVQGNIIPTFSVGDSNVAIPNSVLIFIALAILAAFLLNRTLLGRYALAMGSNEEATRLSGVNVKFWKMMVYVTGGLFVAIGAILYSGRFGFVQPAEGVGFELNVIAAAVIGGTSLSGGRANILGTVIGALIMQTLTKGLQMMGFRQEWQLVVTGIVVLLAVLIDIQRQRRANAV